MVDFELIPYPADNLPKIAIGGDIQRADNQLSLHYAVTGGLESILIPPKTDNVTRKDELWKATCFEYFLALPTLPQYWEFNMSPSGNWNIYVMDAYRQINMRQEQAFTHLPYTFNKVYNQITLDITVDLNPILKIDSPLEIAIATIIQTTQRNESYWALAHPGAPTAQADFHLRKSFTIHL